MTPRGQIDETAGTAANHDGISQCHAEVAHLKSAAISARILAFVANGATVREAFDWVLGPGYYDCLASEVYDELRVRSAA